MLRELVIENFVLIHRAEIDFSPGFTVITGDTGAGKSLLLKAFMMLLGARGEAKLIGDMGKTATVQAVFDVSPSIRQFLEERAIEHDEELIVRRVLSSDGKNRVFLNGVLTTLQDLRGLAANLVSLAGQHEFQRLLSGDEQRNWLDEFAGVSCQRLSSLLKEATGLRKKLKTLVKKRQEQLRERERLQADAELIDKVNPQPGEEDELFEERKILRQTEKIRGIGQELYQRLYGERESIVESLSECQRLLDKLASIDPSVEGLCNQMNSIVHEADDVAASIRDYIYDLPLDNTRLDEVEDRLFALKGLRKRFGPSIEDVIAYRNRIEEELTSLDDLDTRIQELERELQLEEARVMEEAKKISAKRKEAARVFAQRVQEQLKDLQLDKAVFDVKVESPQEPSIGDVKAHGFDRVTFLFCANPGRSLEPLSEVASGGELSRLLLAIKVVMGRLQGSETLFFDEIDAGLGGEVAEKVGVKLRAISDWAQVIAITHFPQIAAQAHNHLVVKKEQTGERTVSSVREVHGESRAEEIARMLGGESGKAREYAKELLGSVLRGA
ncbi:MAG: DNA repair protein RecN [Thermodesulfobacteria bacterium]|nr:DNA repair protein RecN [Thermodesulfobacteriota bacterium]